MAITKLSILTPPDYIYVGETLGFTIETDGDITSMVANPTGIVAINADKDKITGLRAGTVEFTIKALRKDHQEATLIVNLRCLKKKVIGSNIMLHNRATNRVSSIVSPNVESIEDVVYKLPKTGSGRLITEGELQTKFAFIVKPTIVVPDNGATDVEGWMVSSPYSVNMGFNGELEASIWEYATDPDFNNIIDTKYINRGYPDNTDKTKGPVIHSLSTVYVRVKYVSGTTESDWSDPIMYSTGYKGRDNLTTIATGDFNLGYFGKINFTDCIDYNRYRGNYDTLFDNELLTFSDGEQVTKNDKLYYAGKALTKDTAKSPDLSVAANSGEWLLDTRTNLPTIEWVNGVTGIGFGNTDNNEDRLSTGATSIGAMVNKEEGWIKYVYKGKLCYIPVKPICTQICWNDIAKREIMYGERTFRCGGIISTNGYEVQQMYRIRLMREDEYLALIPALMDGTLASYTQEELGLVDKDDPTTGRLTWLEDFQEGSRRKVGDHTGTIIYETDPKTRTGTVGVVDGITKWEMAYRPVIEYVTEVDEPYRNWPVCHDATDENFQYDQFTDTGYFGTLTAWHMLTGNAIANLVGLTTGYPKFSGTTGWFKFYWHGIIYYGTTHFIRYNSTPKDLNDLGIIYSFDTGNKRTKSINIDNTISYKVSVPIGSRYTPFVESADYKSTTVIPGAYAQHIELYGRVYTNNQTDYYKGIVGNAFDGYQVGDNWTPIVNVDDAQDLGQDIIMSPISSTKSASWDPGELGKYDYDVNSAGSESGLVWIPMLKYAIGDHVWLTKEVEPVDKYVADVPIVTELYISVEEEVYVSVDNKVEIVVKSNDESMTITNSAPAIATYTEDPFVIQGVKVGDTTLTFTAKYPGSDTITKTIKVHVIEALTFTTSADKIYTDFENPQTLTLTTNNGTYEFESTGDEYFTYEVTGDNITITSKDIGNGSITITCTNKAGDVIVKTIPVVSDFLYLLDGVRITIDDLINLNKDKTMQIQCVTGTDLDTSSLHVSPTEVVVDVNGTETISILTTESDFTVDTNSATCYKFDKDTKTITGVSEGTGKLTISVAGVDGTTIKKDVDIEVIDIKMTLDAGTELLDGETYELTNGDVVEIVITN